MNIQEQAIRMGRILRSIDSLSRWAHACRDSIRQQNCPDFWSVELAKAVITLWSLRRTLHGERRNWRAALHRERFAELEAMDLQNENEARAEMQTGVVH